MRRKISMLLLLALILGGMFYLRSHGKQEETAEETETEETEILVEAGNTPKQVTLGTISANEGGGVTITVPKEDGTQETYTFTDVQTDSWYADAVNYVISAGLMKGGEDGPIFLPEYGIQRVDYAIVIYRFANGEEVSRHVSFTDISGKEWFAPYIDWIVSKGYMGGAEDGSFNPLGYLTVEQAIIVLYRYAGQPYCEGSLADYPYAAKISEDAVDAMTWAWNNGLITETACVWYPTQAISRAQVALLLTRCSKMIDAAQ